MLQIPFFTVKICGLHLYVYTHLMKFIASNDDVINLHYKIVETSVLITREQ